MRRLGRVLHLSKNYRLIIRLEPDVEVPMLGETVFDSGLDPVGAVEDLFGPVKSPYAAVRLKIGDPPAYIGRTLYAAKKPRAPR
ncbi:MAG: Gar1/Naf1 family protein [Candidatus Bathyarchaeia archaeon]|nr:H/ACA RNA-protein complex protein Gar1 [Candidatus Bathyarchaeota archaeon]